MSIALELNYYYGEEANQYHFYRIPKALFTDAHFKGMSAESKILYGLMLDRMGLSSRNGWQDANGRVYIYFTLDDAIGMMGFGHNKIVRLFRELEEIGLIERKKQGQGRPTRIYVKSFVLPSEAEEAEPASETSENGKSEADGEMKQADTAPPDHSETSQRRKSALPETGAQDFPKEAGNENERKQTEMSDTEYPIHLSTPSRSKRRDNLSAEARMRCMEYYREQIRENIEYSYLRSLHPNDMDRIDGYIELMAEICSSTRDYVRVNQEDIPTDAARARFLSLDRENLLYVLECMNKTTTQIGNIRAYTLSALYNAPATMEQYYASLVNHDMAEWQRS